MGGCKALACIQRAVAGRIQTVRLPQSSPAISHLAWGVTITVAATVGTLLAN